MNNMDIKTISEILEHFPNGEERFNKDPLFNKVIIMIAHGGDFYKIIDTLITSNNEISEAFRNYLLKH
jgi:hypothetical protein